MNKQKIVDFSINLDEHSFDKTIYMRKTEKIEIHKPDHCQHDDIQEVWCKCGWNDIQREAELVALVKGAS